MQLALAETNAGRGARIINADSAQVYADLTVLSARPRPDDTRGISHRLFGAWDGATACSAADWSAAAAHEIADAHRAGALPILVGGTGFYLRTLLDGIAPVPPIDPAVRAAVRALPVSEAYAALTEEDPKQAALLAPADSARIMRALEVVRATGSPLSFWQATREGGIAERIALHPVILMPDRAWLYARCDLRFEAMWHGGAIAEVEALLARKLDPALPVMQAIGVAEIAALLRGEINETEAIAAGQQATRRYAKRQYTWLRNQPPVHWPRIGYENSTGAPNTASLFQF